MSKDVKKLVFYAMAIALTCVATMALAMPNFLVVNGYINLGDTMVILSGLIFGRVGGMIAGGIGSALADILLAFPLYAPITLLVKGLEGFIAGLFKNKKKKKYIGLVAILSAIWMVVGYFLFEMIFLYGFKGAIANLVGNLTQALVGALLATIIYHSLDKIGLLVRLDAYFSENK